MDFLKRPKSNPGDAGQSEVRTVLRCPPGGWRGCWVTSQKVAGVYVHWHDGRNQACRWEEDGGCSLCNANDAPRFEAYFGLWAPMTGAHFIGAIPERAFWQLQHLFPECEAGQMRGQFITISRQDRHPRGLVIIERPPRPDFRPPLPKGLNIPAILGRMFSLRS